LLENQHLIISTDKKYHFKYRFRFEHLPFFFFCPHYNRHLSAYNPKSLFQAQIPRPPKVTEFTYPSGGNAEICPPAPGPNPWAQSEDLCKNKTDTNTRPQPQEESSYSTLLKLKLRLQPPLLHHLLLTFQHPTSKTQPQDLPNLVLPNFSSINTAPISCRQIAQHLTTLTP